MTHFALLQDLAERIELNAIEVPTHNDDQPFWRSVGFTLAGQTFLADAGEVAEILQPPKLTKVPGVRSWVLGVANIRGRLIPIMDLATLLNVTSEGTWRSRRVLIIEQTDGPVGFVVDAVLGMQQFSLNQRGEKTNVNHNLEAFVPFSFEKDGEQWPVFKLRELMQTQEFLHISL